MDETQIKEHFKVQAINYVSLMNKLIPEYDKFQMFLCNLIPFGKNEPIKILDLGTGPGVLAELVLSKYPLAKIHLFDLTKEMLDTSQTRLEQYKDRISVQQGDFKIDDFGTGYDAVLAGLTLHHLTAKERRLLFTKLILSIKDGGVFLTRDIIIDDDSMITELHYTMWREYLKSMGEDDGFWYEKHKQKDHPITIKEQLSFLKEVGFSHVACHWQNCNFAIMSARK